MKDHLRPYFPQRFEDGGMTGLVGSISRLLDTPLGMRKQTNCERNVKYVWKQSDELRLLAGAMKKYGCNFKLVRHVSCEQCSNCSGGFDPDTNQIVICDSISGSHSKILSTLMHEMIHMFDYCRAKFDFANLEHVACSEIRAANLTYCSISDRIVHGGPGIFDLKRTHQYCVKDIAFQSIRAYSPESSDTELWNVVDKVFPDCYNDLEPFGRRPTSGVRDLKHSYRERFHYNYDLQ